MRTPDNMHSLHVSNHLFENIRSHFHRSLNAIDILSWKDLHEEAERSVGNLKAENGYFFLKKVNCFKAKITCFRF